MARQAWYFFASVICHALLSDGVRVADNADIEAAKPQQLALTILQAKLFNTGQKKIDGFTYEDQYYMTADMTGDDEDEPFKTETRKPTEAVGGVALLLWHEKAYLNAHGGDSSLRLTIYQMCKKKKIWQFWKKKCTERQFGQAMVPVSDLQQHRESEVMFHDENAALVGKVMVNVEVLRQHTAKKNVAAKVKFDYSSPKKKSRAASPVSKSPKRKYDDDDDDDDGDDRYDEDDDDDDDDEEIKSIEDRRQEAPADCEDWEDNDVDPSFWSKVESRRRPGTFVYQYKRAEPKNCQQKRVASPSLACKYTRDPSLC